MTKKLNPFSIAAAATRRSCRCSHSIIGHFTDVSKPGLTVYYSQAPGYYPKGKHADETYRFFELPKRKLVPPAAPHGRSGHFHYRADSILRCTRSSPESGEGRFGTTRCCVAIHVQMPPLRPEYNDQVPCGLEKRLHDLRVRQVKSRLLSRHQKVTALLEKNSTTN